MTNSISKPQLAAATPSLTVQDVRGVTKLFRHALKDSEITHAAMGSVVFALGSLSVKPAQKAHEKHKELIKEHKQALIAKRKTTKKEFNGLFADLKAQSSSDTELLPKSIKDKINPSYLKDIQDKQSVLAKRLDILKQPSTFAEGLANKNFKFSYAKELLGSIGKTDHLMTQKYVMQPAGQGYALAKVIENDLGAQSIKIGLRNGTTFDQLGTTINVSPQQETVVSVLDSQTKARQTLRIPSYPPVEPLKFSADVDDATSLAAHFSATRKYYKGLIKNVENDLGKLNRLEKNVYALSEKQASFSNAALKYKSTKLWRFNYIKYAARAAQIYGAVQITAALLSGADRILESYDSTKTDNAKRMSNASIDTLVDVASIVSPDPTGYGTSYVADRAKSALHRII